MALSSQSRQAALIRRPKALPKDDAQLLEECEAQLREGMTDFVSIGSALATIKERKLYRENYASFNKYCQEKWALARRTVHQKLAVYQAYETIRTAYGDSEACADDLPTNEYQIRQLLVLATPDLQWQAWQRAMALWEANPRRAGKITAETVKMAANETLAKPHCALQHYLTVDRSFSHIPWCLEVCTVPPGTSIPQFKIDLKALRKYHAERPLVETPASSPFVLISPQYDLFSLSSQLSFLPDFIKLLWSEPSYHFILWTGSLNNIASCTLWPPNVELAVRVNIQDEVNDFMADSATVTNKPKCGLWLAPYERIDLPPGVSLSRVLMSAPGWMHQHTDEDLAEIRRLLGSVLDSGLPVHLHTSCRNALAKLAPNLPDVRKVKPSPKILAAMYGEQSTPATGWSW